MNVFKKILSLAIIGIACLNLSLKGQSIEQDLEAIANVVVDINGSGDYTSVQQAFNAIANNSSETTIVFVKKGVYQEKVILNHKKTNVVLVGEDVDSTIITWDDWGDKMLVNGDPAVGGHTFSTYSFRADPHGFQAYNITFDNPTTFGQGVAFHSNGDKQVLYHCRLTGNQDTYFDNFRTRRLFKDCYIEGTTDFIFGYGVTLFDSCQILGKGGPLTASSTPQHYEFGHVFKDCRITTAPNASNVPLGRPWFPYANTMFYECWMSDGIKARGWDPWSGREATCIYLEYNNFGPGADTTERVIGTQLDPALADRYTMENIFGADNFPSDMGIEVDTAEFFSMRRRFSESGYTARADTILYAGRDTFPEYPTEDWMPEYNWEVRNIVDKYNDAFNDSINLNANIVEIKYQNDISFELTPGIEDYHIELDPSTTEVPVFQVFTENPRATVEIEYPESLPGMTSILVTAYDRSNNSRVNVYNSINNAYTKATMDSIFIKNIKVSDFQPDVYEYDFQLPKGSSRYFGVKIYKSVEDASSRTIKPSSLPGELKIIVTAVDAETVNEYVFNISVSTALKELNWNGFGIFSNKENLHLNIEAQVAKSVTLSLTNLKGQSVLMRELDINPGTNQLALPVQLQKGIYLYNVSDGESNISGKIQVR